MPAWILAAASSLWFGILTSISPCPLATNITAMSFVGRRVGSPKKVLLAGVLYTLGRCLTYLALGSLLVASLLSAPRVSLVLQKTMNKALGPILIAVGILLLEIIPIHLPSSGFAQRVGERIAKWGLFGAFLLGVLFALTFCPVSAALFFGSLLPLAIEQHSPVLLPALYGIGTGVPVLGFAIAIALGAQSLGKVFGRLTKVERWVRRITGAVFIGVGIYLTLLHLVRVWG
ncbi:MAG: aromatic aminobenezylarsenical efflux permease ArsG family transporter [Candidatus Bipolaricaulota bacterium]|nr:aromatic aminobenezylarsenical efflux permease ArsG family transporter [Candidatus Bipolaricaulota bacterium]